MSTSSLEKDPTPTARTDLNITEKEQKEHRRGPTGTNGVSADKAEDRNPEERRLMKVTYQSETLRKHLEKHTQEADQEGHCEDASTATG